MAEATWRRRFRAARVGLPSWARDAPERCLYGSNAPGKWELYAWDRGSDEHRQVTDRAEGTLAGAVHPTGDWVWWFDDERGNERGVWMVEPFVADGSAAEPAVGSLPPAYSVGLALGRGVAVVGSSDDDGTRIHASRDGGAPDLVYEHREEAEVGGLSRDETLLCIVHSEAGDSRHPDLRVVDLSGATVAELSDGPGRALWPMGWSRVPGDQRLLVRHERGDMPRPLVWSARDGAERELKLDLPGEVEASWCPDAASLLLSHDHRGRSELYRYDLDGDRLERLDTPPGSIYGARVRPDGEVWFLWNSAVSPWEVRAGDRLLLRPPGEPAPPGVPFGDLDVDGIHGFVARPAAVVDPPVPTLFWVHGGPEAQDADEFDPLVQAWVDHGYAVVMVNYRGSAGYGRAWRDAIEGNPGLTELADLARVRDWAVESGLADPDRVVLGGGSWGGYLTLLGLGTQTVGWSLGIAAVPVADYVAAYDDEMEPLKAFDKALFGGTPAEIPDVYLERSPLTYVEEVAVPVFVLAGENDPRCPIRQIDNYLARLGELGKPHGVYRYDAGHGSLVVEERIRQTEAMLAFASRHLGTTPPLP